jgi:putative membrane fusion protein
MNKKVRVFINWFILIAILLGMAYLVYDVFYLSTSKSYSLEYGRIEINIPAEAIVLRDETVIETHASGQIQYMIAEGEKIKKNQLVAQIRLGEFPILEEDDQGDESEQTSDVSIDIESLDYEIAFLTSKIRYAIRNARYAEIYNFKADLLLKLEKRMRLTEIVGETPTVSESTDEGIVLLMSPMSGVVSYYLDGYEDVLLDSNLYAIDFEQLAKQLQKPVNYSTRFVQEMDEIYKVVDSNHWQIVALIDPFERDFFSIGQSIEVVINEEHIDGQVMDLIEQGEQLAVLIDMQQLVNDFQKMRKIEVALYPINYKGLLIENSSIVKQNGAYGVYVLNVSNQTDFVPIKIVGYDEDSTIVIGDTFTEKGTKVRTVSLYDEVIKNGSALKEE